MDERNAALAQECKNAETSCLYTSTCLFIRIRFLTVIKCSFIAASVLLGSLASWGLLTSAEDEIARLTVAILAFLAGLLPTLYSALKLDDALSSARQFGGEFKNLQDRFRHASTVSALKPFEEFQRDFEPLMLRLEEVRRPSYTPPDWCFYLEEKKIKAGHYRFDNS